MKKYLIASFVWAALLLAAPTAGLANPARPDSITKRLPDGTTLTIRVHGDEHFHWTSTTDGLPLLLQPDGFYHYAEVQPDGSLLTSGTRAVNVSNRPASQAALIQRLQAASSQWLQARVQLGAEQSRRSPLRIAPRPRRLKQNGFPTDGKRKALAILVDFPAMVGGRPLTFSHDNPRDLFRRMLNEEGFHDEGATGSVRDYFLDCSSGAFDLTFDVYGPITLSRPVSYYGGNGERQSWEMVVEACQALDGEVDFTQYDQNGDGEIDNVYLFYAGENEPDTDRPELVWPHAADIRELDPTNTYTFDGCVLNHYACSNEGVATSAGTLQLAGIGNCCHEFSHVLGLPDLYNTADQSGSFTPRRWSLMDIGSYNNESHTPPTYSAFERLSLGWIEPYTLREPEDITLPPLSQNVACLIPTTEKDEYFLLENRQQSGWDTYLPAHGMLIWHIAYDAQSWANNVVNNVHQYQRVDLEEADGGNVYDSYAGNPFPGSTGATAFTDDTTPNAHTLFTDAPTGMPITDIAEAANGMVSFKVSGGYSKIAAPQPIRMDELSPIAVKLSWSSVVDASRYVVNAYERSESGALLPLSAYQDFEVATTQCELTGLQPEHTYSIYLQSVDATGRKGAPSAALEVTLPKATFAYIPPTLYDFTDVQPTQFTLAWQPLAEADRYVLDLTQLNPGEPSLSTADFTGGVTALPQGWSTSSTMTISTAGNYGAAAPALSLSSAGAYLQTPITLDHLRGFDFWYRQRNAPTAGNFIQLIALCGEALTPVVIDSIALSTTLVAGQVYQLDASLLPAATRALRISYAQQGKGALAIDDVHFYFADNFEEGTRQSFTTADTTFTFRDNITPLTTYRLTVSGQRGDLSSAPATAMLTTPATDPTGLTAVHAASSTFSVQWSGAHLIVPTTLRPLQVVDATGRIIGRLPAASAPQRLPITAPGVYVVTDGQHSIKVVR